MDRVLVLICEDCGFDDEVDARAIASRLYVADCPGCGASHEFVTND